jgi:hypothetical protein
MKSRRWRYGDSFNPGDCPDTMMAKHISALEMTMANQAKVSSVYSGDFELEGARSICMAYMPNQHEPTAIREVRVMPNSMEEVDFISSQRCADHSIFREVVSRPFPVKY